MHRHFSPKRFCLLLMIVGSLSGCKKAISIITNNLPPPDTTGTNTTDTIPPAVTPVGTPIGNKVTKTIGAGGGSLTSDDGRVQLTIPPGALSANTDISIQAVTNNCPAGIGVAYNFLPNGTKFSTPASLTFNYTDSDVNGTDPLLLFTAFQDSIGQWEVIDSDKEVDSVGKTVSFDISHFTIMSLGPGVYISPTLSELSANQESSLKVNRWLASKKNSTILVPAQPYTVSQVSDWAVNGVLGGSVEDGTIIADGPGALATYTAPESIDQNRTVQVSVKVNEPQTIRQRPGKVIVFQDHIYNLTLKLIGNISFQVDIYLTQTGLSGILPDVYHDAASMVVNVKNNIVDIPEANITNQAPTVTPSSDGDQQNGPGYTWIPDQTGYINIESAIGLVSPASNGTPTQVTVILTGGGTVEPQYTIHDPVNGTYSFGGDASTPWPPGVVFVLRDSTQIYNIKPGWGYSVTPIH